MIKREELRFDNLVFGSIRPDEPVQINSIDKTICKAGEYLEGYESVNPISLTEEWLIRMGFDKIRDGQMSPDIYGKYYTRVLVTSVIELQHDGLDCRWMEGNTNVPIEFVHQLQNLYFSLTGEELTIK